MADIKISELSIGDWVEIDGAATKVWYLSEDSEINDTTYDWVKPIPITPEILEKNGISKTYESDEYAVYKGEGFNVTEYYTELWEFERHRNRLMIRNVHQLQHALRLAGVEKEIEA